MNKIMIVLLITTGLLGTKAWGQGFLKSYNIPNTHPNNGIAIIAKDTSYTFVTNPNSLTTGYICAGVINTNTDGIKQWDNLLESNSNLFSPNANLTKIDDTTYVFSGGLGYPSNPWQIFYSRLNTQENTFETNEYGNMDLEEIGTNIIIQDDTLITGVSYGDVNPYTYYRVRIIRMCPDFSLIDSVNLVNVAGYVFNGTYFLYKSADNYIYIPILCRNPGNPIYLVIRKIDLQGNTIWEYPLNTYTTYTNTPTRIIALPNGNIVTHWFDEGAGGANDQRNPYLICLSPSGEFVWRHDFNDSGYRKFPVQISLATNGDIIGCGTSQNPISIYDIGWLFRQLFSVYGKTIMYNAFFQPIIYFSKIWQFFI